MLNSHQYLSLMLGTLFEAEERRLQKNVDILHDQNQEALRQSLDGFMFQGKFYRHSNSATGGGKRSTLHLSLWPKMYDHLADEAQINLDRQLIRQVLFRQLQDCNSAEDIRDAVPECIVDTLPPEISSLHRMRETSSFIRMPRDQRQYDAAIPRIEFYSAARLLY